MWVVINAHSQSVPNIEFAEIYSSQKIVFKRCRMVNNYATKATIIDTISAYPDAIYGRVGESILCVHNCGSIYVFKAYSASSSFQPAYFSDNCFGQFDLAKYAIAVNKEYVFILSNTDTYFTNPSVKLLLVNMTDAKVKTIDKGKIESEFTYWNEAKILFYNKNGMSMRCSILRQVRERIGF